MTDEEAVRFLREFLQDYEAHARFIQDGYRLSRSLSAEQVAERSRTAQSAADSLTQRSMPARALLQIAAVPFIPLLDPKFTNHQMVSNVRTAVMQAIGAFEHGMVRHDRAAERGGENQAAPQTDTVELPARKLTLKERIDNNPIRWIAWALAVGATVGFSAGFFLRDLVNAAVRRVATVESRPAATPPQVPPSKP